MNIKSTSTKVALAASFLLLAGCGGSSDSDPAEEIVTLTGVFLDSPVANVDYQTETQSGVTNADGEYEFVAGENVTFSIGALEFPPVAAAEIVTPLEIAGTDDPNDTEALNMIRLLQTLDKDGDPSNGIEITEDAKGAATAIDSFDIPEAEFAVAVDSLIEGGGQDEPVTELVSSTEAVAHFQDTLEENGVEFDSIEGSWHLADENILHFLPGNQFLALQLENEFGQVGFEYGTYSLADGNITFVTRVNHDGDALTCNEDRGVLCDGSDGIEPGVWGYALSDEGQLVITVEGENYNFDKAAETDSPLDGLWEFREDSQFFYFANGSSGGSGDFYIMRAELANSSSDDDSMQAGTYTLSNSDTELELATEKAITNNGLDCTSDCVTEDYAFSILNGQLLLIVPEDSARYYLDPLFDADAPANTATLIAQKDYDTDLAASEDYGVDTEDDFKLYIRANNVETSAPESFKASFTIDESSYLTRTENGSLQVRLQVYYENPSVDGMEMNAELRLRYYGVGPSAQFYLIGCPDESCDEDVLIRPDNVALEGDFIGDHEMEIAFDDTTSTFVFSIDGVEVGSIPVSDFTGHQDIVAAGGYTFDSSHFDQVRFRLNAYDLDSADDTVTESGLLKVHMDEFTIDDEVYDDFSHGLDDTKWDYEAEDE